MTADATEISTVTDSAAMHTSAVADGDSLYNRSLPDGMGLLAIIREDWNAHGRDWTLPGFRAVAAHRFGVWRMGIRPGVLRFPFSVFYRMLYRRARNHYGIELPFSVK